MFCMPQIEGTGSSKVFKRAKASREVDWPQCTDFQFLDTKSGKRRAQSWCLGSSKKSIKTVLTAVRG